MDNANDHWLEDEKAQGKFCAYVAETGLSKKQVFGLLKPAASIEALALEPQEASHGEAQAIAWADVYAPDGTRISLTARQGATADDVVATAIAWQKAWAMLQGLGWTPTPGQARQQQREAQPKPTAPQQQIPAAPPPLTSTPPPPSASAPPTPPSDSGNGNVEMIDTVRVTAPKGKPQVEFWRTGRKYPELKWSLGGKALMEIAPTLVAAGWTPAHFDNVGQEYQLALKIHWTPSPKNPKWKDVTAVELAG